jgi:4-nitrophenyl phosphatase
MPLKNNFEQLKGIRCFLLDMDGTFYLDNQLLPGAREFIQFCAEKQIKVLFITNNSSRNARNYVEKLGGLGIPVDIGRIITSGETTCLFLKKHYPNKKVFLAGTSALEEEFRQQGIRLVQDNPDLVVLGFDTTITYAKLWKLCDLVRAGLPFIATHPDSNCPTSDGFMPDIGAMIAFIAASTGRQPDVIIGKPNTPILDFILQKVNLPREQVAMVGDRLYTDIAMGRNGIRTILVLSGETNLEQARQSEFQADWVVEDLSALLNLLTQ